MLLSSYDAFIIGVGINGLACDARLAASGCKVLVLEAGANTVEFTPGFQVSGLAHRYQGLDPRVAVAMKLDLAQATNVATTAQSTSGDHLTILDTTL